MSINHAFITITGCVVAFMWGMAVDKNDQRMLAAYDAQMEMEARQACGPGHLLAVAPEGLACMDRDGNTTLLAEVTQ